MGRDVRYRERPAVYNYHKYKYKHLLNLLIKKYGNLLLASERIGWNITTFRSMLQGKTQPRKDLIDAMLQGLDITYEEAFVEDYE